MCLFSIWTHLSSFYFHCVLALYQDQSNSELVLVFDLLQVVGRGFLHLVVEVLLVSFLLLHLPIRGAFVLHGRLDSMVPKNLIDNQTIFAIYNDDFTRIIPHRLILLVRFWEHFVVLRIKDARRDVRMVRILHLEELVLFIEGVLDLQQVFLLWTWGSSMRSLVLLFIVHLYFLKLFDLWTYNFNLDDPLLVLRLMLVNLMSHRSMALFADFVKTLREFFLPLAFLRRW